MEAKDLLGNVIHVGDEVLFGDGEVMPWTSIVTKVTEKRCYFKATGKKKFQLSDSFRALHEVVSLTALNIQDCAIIYCKGDDHRDMAGTELEEGMDVVAVGHSNKLCIATVIKLTPKMCDTTVGSRYSSYLLAVKKDT